MRKQHLLSLILGIVFVLSCSISALAADVQHKAVLGGVVTSVAPVGENVKEGDVLLTVNALAGPVPAVRSSVNGVVKAVMVHPGSEIHQGEVVVVIESR